MSKKVYEHIYPAQLPTSSADTDHTQWVVSVDTAVRELAQSYLDREPEDWTWCDPEDVKRLARAVLAG